MAGEYLYGREPRFERTRRGQSSAISPGWPLSKGTGVLLAELKEMISIPSGVGFELLTGAPNGCMFDHGRRFEVDVETLGSGS